MPRSLAKCFTEHFGDAESFSKKSHMMKHKLVSHGEMDTMPPFRIKILKKYRDCYQDVWGKPFTSS